MSKKTPSKEQEKSVLKDHSHEVLTIRIMTNGFYIRINSIPSYGNPEKMLAELVFNKWQDLSDWMLKYLKE